MLKVRETLEKWGIDVVNESGSQLYAFCPFHNNKNTPAFTINKFTGLWICFNESCGKSGTLTILGNLLGKDSPMGGRVVSDDEIVELLFPKEKQEIDVDTIKINYETESDKLQYLVDRGFSLTTLEYFEVGFSNNKQRIVLPVRDENFRAIGFIGRTIRNEDPKYLYTKGFKRATVLFNLQNAKIYDSVIVVEGSLDALKVHQAGLPNVVSTLGSNVTDSQIQLLKSHFEKIIIFSDQDEAGKGMQTGIMNRSPEKDLWVVQYPEGPYKDPGDLSEIQIREAIENKIDYLSYMFIEQNT